MLLQLDFSSDVPIYMQIRNQIVHGIARNALQPGEKLPPIRALADECGINMMTVNKAYQLLKQEGYIEIDRRSGAVVSGHKQMVLDERAMQALRLLISEAKLSGLSRAAVLELCGQFYDEMEGAPCP